jgi:hypothetical protein
MPADAPRIIDLSEIRPENFKERNEKFLMDEDLHYDIASHQSRQDLHHDIWVVRNGDLRKLLRKFPLNKPLRVQCANWMHAVVGKHFFPDANHRTAIALLRDLLWANGIHPGNWPTDQTRAVRDESHRVRDEIEPVTLDTLYRRDKLYLVWWRYFVEVLRHPEPLEE